MKSVRRVAAALLCFILLALSSGCGNGSTAVMSIGNYEVTRDIYRYVVINSRNDIESAYGSDVWESDRADEARTELCENIKEYLAKMYTVCELGRELGMEWNSDEVHAAAVLERNSAIEDAGGEDEFKALLKQSALTEDAYMFVISNDILNGSLPDLISEELPESSDDELLRELFMSDDFIRVKQILIGGENAGTDEENLIRAERIYARLNNGEDFDELSHEYNNDLFMFSNDDGYYIMRGSRDTAFEEAAFSLDLGEISEIVKTEAGYSIILRCEKDEAYFDKNVDAVLEEYIDTIYTKKFEEKLAQLSENMTKLPEKIDILKLS